jgi:hypothetical protein
VGLTSGQATLRSRDDIRIVLSRSASSRGRGLAITAFAGSNIRFGNGPAIAESLCLEVNPNATPVYSFDSERRRTIKAVVALAGGQQ